MHLCLEAEDARLLETLGDIQEEALHTVAQIHSYNAVVSTGYAIGQEWLAVGVSYTRRS